MTSTAVTKYQKQRRLVAFQYPSPAVYPNFTTMEPLTFQLLLSTRDPNQMINSLKPSVEHRVNSMG
ncbi:hypothetical protein MJO29_000905 [Puccinia striiformis f. sp. tritici]|nr:hypothetical protein MJO29_000905 [Puccinia striiformis f. sp. tritici]